MSLVNNSGKDSWISFLYFSFKKAKHFVKYETTFVDEIELLKFEENLENNIRDLAELLDEPEKLKEKIKKRKGYLYFVPKSLGEDNEARIRPKVTFPFYYQVMWAAIILRIGEWFDTNSQLKNMYSMQDEELRKELDWMVPWSFNGRIKRLKRKASTRDFNDSYIQYNDQRLYDSHQYSLRNYNTYKLKVLEKLFKSTDKVYKGDLDIQEFFPTLEKEKIMEMFRERFYTLNNISNFKEKYFDPELMQEIIEILFSLEIDYPSRLDEEDEIFPIFKKFFEDIKTEKNKEINNSTSDILGQILKRLNKTLPLDLIASNFLSNCTLNYFVDKKLELNQNVFVLRYTDDYEVISNNKDRVIEVIEQLKKLLESLGLKPSDSKTLPTRVREIYKKLRYRKSQCEWPEWLNEKSNLNKNILDLEKDKLDELHEVLNKLLCLNIQLKPQIIDKQEIGGDLIISRLSATTDMNVKALTDEELGIYMNELKTYLKADGNIGELKEETAKIFASWRLNASYQELISRKALKLDKITSFFSMLENVIKSYPHKLGYVDIYVLILFKLIETNNEGYQRLKTFLLDINNILYGKKEDVHDKFNNDKMAIYFSAIRIRVLKSFSRNWRRFDKKQRIKLRSVLKEVFLNWYASPKIYWEELYTMNISLFTMRIRLPLNNRNLTQSEPEFLSDIFQIYNNYLLSNVYKSGNCVNEEAKVKQINVKGAVFLLRNGLYRNRTSGRFVFNEVDESIYNNIKDQLTANGDQYDKLSFARIAPEKMNEEDWDVLTSCKSNVDEKFAYKLYDFLQFVIKLYFSHPKSYESILKWSQQADEKNLFRKYVKNRFCYLSKIRANYSLTDIKYAPLRVDNNHLKNLCNSSKKTKNDSDFNATVKIPIADWVFYCQTLPYHLEISPEKQRVLHPLTEYEFIKILEEIKKSSDYENEKPSSDCEDNDLVNKNPLFSTKLTITDWENLRETNARNNNRSNNCYKNDNSKKKAMKDNYNTGDYVRILFTLLTNRPWHTHVNEKFSMYKWHDLQSYFDMAYYPSTSVANLFVNNLNIHQNFYFELYNMPTEELPYRNVYAGEETNNIDIWIKQYLERNTNNRVYQNDNRQIELLEINIDQLGDR